MVEWVAIEVLEMVVESLLFKGIIFFQYGNYNKGMAHNFFFLIQFLIPPLEFVTSQFILLSEVGHNSFKFLI